MNITATLRESPTPLEKGLESLATRADAAYICFGCTAFVTGKPALRRHVRHCREHKIPRSTPFNRYVRACARQGKFQRELTRQVYICPHCVRYRTLEPSAYRRHQAGCARAAWRIRAMEIRKRKYSGQNAAGRSLGYYRAQVQAGRPLVYYQQQVRRANASFADLTLIHEVRLRRQCEAAGLQIWEEDDELNNALSTTQQPVDSNRGEAPRD